jgi:hypothetical protein
MFIVTKSHKKNLSFCHLNVIYMHIIAICIYIYVRFGWCILYIVSISLNSIWISSLKVLTVCICFWSLHLWFSDQLQIIHVKGVTFLSLLCALHILCSTYSVVQWEGLIKCKIAVVIVSLLEIFHIVFLCLLLILAYFLCVGAYVFSISSWPSWWMM